MINKLLEAGYKAENIYLAYGKWNKNATPADDETVYNLMKAFIKANVKEELNIKKLKEIFTTGIKIDGIIANPPYGAIGANITDTIREKIAFDEYVNLLPANDYKRNKNKDLFNYQSDMINVNDGFADAAVTTHLAKISKTKTNNMTLDEFERSQYLDRSLDKYFAENNKRCAQAEDKYLPSRDLIRAVGPTRSLIFTKRDVNHKHLPYSKKTNSYKWNVEESITSDYLIENTAVDFNNAVSVELLIYETPIAKQHMANLLYSELGFKFISKIFTAVNVDSRIELNKILPQLDLTRSWTVEEILADYGYTPDEIKEVIEDLKNFKGMDD